MAQQVIRFSETTGTEIRATGGFPSPTAFIRSSVEQELVWTQ